MHPKDTARQRAEALFKPSVPKATIAKAPNPFDSIKSRAALAHSINKLRRSDRPEGAILRLTMTDAKRES